MTDGQEEQILYAYGVMHQMLSKCAAERDSHVLPQLGLDGMHVPKASIRHAVTQELQRHVHAWLSVHSFATVLKFFDVRPSAASQMPCVEFTSRI